MGDYLMNYNNKEEFFNEICNRINNIISEKNIVETEISNKYNTYDKGDAIIFSFNDVDDYQTVMKQFKDNKRTLAYDDNYLEFKFNIKTI